MNRLAAAIDSNRSELMEDDFRGLENNTPNGRWRHGHSISALMAEVHKDVRSFADMQQDFSVQMQTLIHAVQSMQSPYQPQEAQLLGLNGQGTQLRHAGNAAYGGSGTLYSDASDMERKRYVASPAKKTKPHAVPDHYAHDSRAPEAVDEYPKQSYPPMLTSSQKAKYGNGAMHYHNAEMIPGVITVDDDVERPPSSRNTLFKGLSKEKKADAKHPKHNHPSPPETAPWEFSPAEDDRTEAKSRKQVTKSLTAGAAELSSWDFKEKVKQQLTRTPYNVANFYWPTGIWQHVARAQWFENVTLAIIASNALWLWIDTDYNDSDSLLNAHWVFQFVENAFCMYFSVELLVRFMAFKHKLNCLRDAWFCFDSFLVITMVLETWVMTIVMLASSGSGSLMGGNSSIMRLARLLRLSRMCRMARLVRAVPELGILIKGMVASMRSVCTTLFLLVIVIYIFAIAFTQLTVGMEVGTEVSGMDNGHLFANVGRSMYSLWLYGVLCLDFAEIISYDMGPVIAPLYYVFILLAPFTIMNMLIGVLCEVVSAVSCIEKEENLLEYARDKLQDIMNDLDKNHNGVISKNEFQLLLEKKEACLILNDLGIDVAGLIDFADVIFESEDDDDSETELDFTQFVDLVLQLRGSSHATVKDVVELRKLIKSMAFPQPGLTPTAEKGGRTQTPTSIMRIGTTTA